MTSNDWGSKRSWLESPGMTLTTSFGDFQRFGGRKFCQELGLVSVMCEELRHIFQPLDKPDGTSSFFRG